MSRKSNYPPGFKYQNWRTPASIAYPRWVKPEKVYYSSVFQREIATGSAAHQYERIIGRKGEEAAIAEATKIDAEHDAGAVEAYLALIKQKNKAVKHNDVNYFTPSKIRVLTTVYLPSDLSFPRKFLKGALPNIPKLYLGRKLNRIRRNEDFENSQTGWNLELYELGNGLFAVMENYPGYGFSVETLFEIPLHVGKKRFFEEFQKALLFLLSKPNNVDFTADTARERNHRMYIKDDEMFWSDKKWNFKKIGSVPTGESDVQDLLNIIEICFNFPWAVR